MSEEIQNNIRMSIAKIMTASLSHDKPDTVAGDMAAVIGNALVDLNRIADAQERAAEALEGIKSAIDYKVFGA